MIDAGSFARKVIAADSGSLSFGNCSRDDMAAVLHRFADQVADGTILVQRVQSGAVTSFEDFHVRALMIEYHELISGAS